MPCFNLDLLSLPFMLKGRTPEAFPENRDIICESAALWGKRLASTHGQFSSSFFLFLSAVELQFIYIAFS